MTKILHTSDWHLGKKLLGVDRLSEQVLVMDELVEIAISEKVDLVIVAGDIFDTAVPRAEAEELFYETAVKLSRHAPVIFIAGNHDDSERLAAARQLARLNDIIIVGGFNVPAKTKRVLDAGSGWLKLGLNSGVANIVVLPYPTDALLNWQITDGVNFSSRVGERLQTSAQECFDSNGINVIVSHLFVRGGIKSGDERDIELGTAKLIDPDDIPDCHYCALGHIHKPMRVSKERFIEYPGAVMQYSFDETGAEKSVNIVDIDVAGVNGIRRVPLQKSKKLAAFTVGTMEDALKVLDENAEKLVRIVLSGEKPHDQTLLKAVKTHPALADFRVEYKKAQTAAALTDGINRPPREVFKLFCEYLNQKPDDALADLFCEIISEEL